MEFNTFNLGIVRLRIKPKILLIMKLIVVMITTCLMQVSASTFGQYITLSEKNTSVQQLLKMVKQQSGYDVLYKDEVLAHTKKVSLSLVNAPLNDALDKILENQLLTYTIKEKTIVIKAKEPSFLDRLASVISTDGRDLITDITGVVRNERGEPLEGITVMVKGAKTGTRTNAKGEFVLKGVKKGDVLVFTGVAIEPFEYTVKDDKNIDLNLKARLVQLEEVGINTGYQKISKERFVGSYSQLDSAAFHRRAGMGILERLDGTVTGVLFNKKGGSIGGQENPIQIRGISTLNSNPNPLIIVDNFPYTLELTTINPNDIENVVVLKDAAATSIWGARAGNGVIVITTKKGKFNQPLKISWNSNLNLQNKSNLFHYPMIKPSDFIDLELFLFSNGAYDDKLNDIYNLPQVSPVIDILNKVKNGEFTETEGKTQIDNFRNIDIRDQLNRYVYQKAVNQQHYLNISGGAQTINYQLSLGYNHHRPEIQNSRNNDQFTVSSNAAFKFGRKININTGLNLSLSNQRSVTLPNFPMYPYLSLKDEEDNAKSVPYQYRLSYLDTVGRGELLNWHFRPIDEIRLSNNSAFSRTTNFSVNLSYEPITWLKFGLKGQYNLQNVEDKNQQDLETYKTRDLINRFTNLSYTDVRRRYPVPLGGILNIDHTKTIGYHLRGDIQVNKSWVNHQFNAIVAGDFSENLFSGNQTGMYGYQPATGGYSQLIDYADLYQDQFGGSSRIPNPNFLHDQRSTRFVSLIGNMSYVYKNKYTLYASARKDGSNLFGVSTNNRWKPLWSIGASWQISNEKFFDLSWIDNLSLRSTYGYSGNINNSYSALLTIGYSSTPDFDTRLNFSNILDRPNPNLRWEEVKTFNTGIDFSFLKGKIIGKAEYFTKYAIDLIGPIFFPASSGVSTHTVNSSSLKGDGFDLNLTGDILSKNFRWQIGYGLSYAKMKVAKVYAPNLYQTRDFLGFDVNPAIGKLAYGISSYRWAGLDSQTGDPQGYLRGQVSKDYLEISRDSVDNQMFHGSGIPLYSGFLLNTFSLKNLTLSFNIVYKFDFYFRRFSMDYSGLINEQNISADFYSRWQKPGDEKFTNVPSFIYSGTNNLRDNFYRFSEVNVLRGDNIRLQDIQIQYRFLTSNRNLSFVKNLNAFLYINNLNIIIWKKNKSHLDPDFAGTTSLLGPSPKTFTLGLSANF